MIQVVLSHRAGGLALAMILPILVPLSAAAQDLPSGTVSPSWTAGPLDPNAPVPAITHQSALGTYRPWAEAAKVPWREANETVTRIGGWRAYLKEAQRPEDPTRPEAPTRQEETTRPEETTRSIAPPIVPRGTR
jgi:hypothetical protein